jgi:2-oxoglutarate dehydrogenase E1 component
MLPLSEIEQLYPLPKKQLNAIIGKYKKSKTWLWVQEEPYNMGAWPFMHLEFKQVPLKVIARPGSGSPATGSSKFHYIQQRKIVDKTFEECICPKVNEECKMVCIGNRWKAFEEELKSMKKDSIESTELSADKQLK